MQPTYSPDGAWIAFTSTGDGNPEIYVMAADGTSVARLTDDPAADFDGRSVRGRACAVSRLIGSGYVPAATEALYGEPSGRAAHVTRPWGSRLPD